MKKHLNSLLFFSFVMCDWNKYSCYLVSINQYTRYYSFNILYCTFFLIKQNLNLLIMIMWNVHIIVIFGIFINCILKWLTKYVAFYMCLCMCTGSSRCSPRDNYIAGCSTLFHSVNGPADAGCSFHAPLIDLPFLHQQVK